jgi:hypothetical protein
VDHENGKEMDFLPYIVLENEKREIVMLGLPSLSSSDGMLWALWA